MFFMHRIYSILLLSLFLFVSTAVFTCVGNAAFEEEAENVFAVDRVIDGDTIRLANRRKVRLLGVKAPELHDVGRIAEEASRYRVDMKLIRKRGEQAYKFLNDSIGKGKVRLAYDWVKRDDEGLTLAYVYLEDGSLLNAAVLSKGLAYFDDRYPFQHQGDFEVLEEDARQKGLGVWAEEK